MTTATTPTLSLADDRAEIGQRLDRAKSSRWQATRASSADYKPIKTPGNLTLLEAWLKSDRPEELFDADRRLITELAALAPVGQRRYA